MSNPLLVRAANLATMGCGFSRRGAASGSVPLRISLEGWNTGFVKTYNTTEGEEHPGDTMTWHADVHEILTGEKGAKVGEITGFAVLVPSGKWETLETISIAGGDIFCHYVQKGYPETQAGITGGTGDYCGASGLITFIAPRDPTANGPWGIEISRLTVPAHL